MWNVGEPRKLGVLLPLFSLYLLSACSNFESSSASQNRGPGNPEVSRHVARHFSGAQLLSGGAAPTDVTNNLTFTVNYGDLGDLGVEIKIGQIHIHTRQSREHPDPLIKATGYRLGFANSDLTGPEKPFSRRGQREHFQYYMLPPKGEDYFGAVLTIDYLEIRKNGHVVLEFDPAKYPERVEAKDRYLPFVFYTDSIEGVRVDGIADPKFELEFRPGFFQNVLDQYNEHCQPNEECLLRNWLDNNMRSHHGVPEDQTIGLEEAKQKFFNRMRLIAP